MNKKGLLRNLISLFFLFLLFFVAVLVFPSKSRATTSPGGTISAEQWSLPCGSVSCGGRMHDEWDYDGGITPQSESWYQFYRASLILNQDSIVDFTYGYLNTFGTIRVWLENMDTGVDTGLLVSCGGGGNGKVGSCSYGLGQETLTTASVSNFLNRGAKIPKGRYYVDAKTTSGFLNKPNNPLGYIYAVDGIGVTLNGDYRPNEVKNYLNWVGQYARDRTVSYTLYRDNTQIYQGTGTSYIDSNIQVGKSYTYKVIMTDNANRTTEASWSSPRVIDLVNDGLLTIYAKDQFGNTVDAFFGGISGGIGGTTGGAQLFPGNPQKAYCPSGSSGCSFYIYWPDIAGYTSPTNATGTLPVYNCKNCKDKFYGTIRPPSECPPSLCTDYGYPSGYQPIKIVPPQKQTITGVYTLPISKYDLTITKPANGNNIQAASNSLSISKINCGAGNICSESYNSGAIFHLSAVPVVGYVLSSWTGCNSTTNDDPERSGQKLCSVKMDSAKTVSANFTANIYTLTVIGSGTGVSYGLVTPSTGTFSWSGTTGTASHLSGTSVTLTASGGSGATLTSWSGCTSTSGAMPNQTCTVVMNANKTISVVFTAIPPAGSASSTVTVSRPSAAGVNVIVKDLGNNTWKAGCASVTECGMTDNPIRVEDKLRATLVVKDVNGTPITSGVTYNWSWKNITTNKTGNIPASDVLDWIIPKETGTYEVSTTASTSVGGVPKTYNAKVTIFVPKIKDLTPS